MSQTLKYFDFNLFVSFFTYVLAYLRTFLISYFRNSRFLSKIVLQLAKARNKYFDYFIILHYHLEQLIFRTTTPASVIFFPAVGSKNNY